MDVMKKKRPPIGKSDGVGTGSLLLVQYRRRLPLLTASIADVFSLFAFVIPTVASAMSEFPTPTAARLSEVTTTFGIMITFLAHPAIHS